MSEVLQTYHELYQALSDDSPNDESLRALSAPREGYTQAHDYQRPRSRLIRDGSRGLRELKRTGTAIGGIISTLFDLGAGFHARSLDLSPPKGARLPYLIAAIWDVDPSSHG